MAGRVAVSFLVVLRSALAVFKPFTRVVWMDIVGVVLYEFSSFRPQGRDAIGTVVDVDIKAVGFVVVLHPRKDIVVHIAEEVNIGLHSPVVLYVLQRRMLTEHAAVPPTHLMIRLLAHILYV